MRFPQKGYREKIWDHCAGAVIVEEAGAIISDAAGSLASPCCSLAEESVTVCSTIVVLGSPPDDQLS